MSENMGSPVSAPEPVSIKASLDRLAKSLEGLQMRIEKHLTDKTAPYRRIYSDMPRVVETKKMIPSEVVSDTRKRIDELTDQVHDIESQISDLSSTIE